MREPSALQVNYARNLQRRMHLTNAVLDGHCERRWGVPFARLDRRQMSDLITEMNQWESVPADLRRAMGQRDLPGME